MGYVEKHVDDMIDRYAEELARLRAENERLRAENERLREGQMHSDDRRAIAEAENVLHALRTGLATRQKGSMHHKAILNEKKVRVILHAIRMGVERKYLGAVFGVSRETISHIANGVRWSHVKV